MKINTRKSFRAATVLASLFIFGVIVSACGDGSSQTAGIGGTGISVGKGIVQGRVTGFGSVYVHGKRFNIDSSNFTVDGNNYVGSVGQAELALGMVVRLEVETQNGMFTDRALDVVYDDQVQGPVIDPPIDVPGTSGTQKTFMVFGQTITIDETETVFAGGTSFGFATVAAGDVVEISGFRSSSNEIIASYVEWQGNTPNGSEVELRGIVSGYTPPTQEFMLDGFLITYDNPGTNIEIGGAGLKDGVYVEVKGAYQTMGPSVHASKIEEDDESLGDEVADVSLEGPVSAYLSIASFKINGQQIDASQASLSPLNTQALLANGVEVEVEGNIVGGVLLADELKVDEVDTKLKAFVLSTSPDLLIHYTGVSGSIEIVTNSGTEFIDQSPMPVANFSLANLSAGDFVAIEGVEVAGKVIAGRIERRDSTIPDDSELDGQADSFVPNTSITVLGISFMVDNGTLTQYMDVSGNTSALLFFGNLKMGDRVEIKDKDPADGFADEVKLDD